MKKNSLKNVKLAVVGLGYVGLPLAVEFGKTILAPIIGYDRNLKKVKMMKRGQDPTGELSSNDLKITRVDYTSHPADLKKANFIIVAVPTPVTKNKKPDLSCMTSASKLVGKNLKQGSIIVFESTVYPGVTEEICGPIIEKYSGLRCGRDFKLGYSPERINPGDKNHSVDKIIKVVSGQDKKTLAIVSAVYSLICQTGVFRAKNIKTAEAAKVIENIQRDLNIALVNELSIIFHKLGIDTTEVLSAASTKWNFHSYLPGLVGGHCIGVDPYYLVYKAQKSGYQPKVITAGRHINDYMPQYTADLMIGGLAGAGKILEKSTVLVLGLTFKENVADIRNSKIKDVIKRLKAKGIKVLAFDPLVKKADAKKYFGIANISDYKKWGKIDGIFYSVPHQQFKEINLNLLNKIRNRKLVIVDIKSIWKKYQIAKNKNIIYINL